jgi:hypothetical protein
MNKFYDEKIAATVGHEAALEIALKGAELGSAVESFNAIRRARGMPSLQEEDAAYLQSIRDDVAEGFGHLHDPMSVAEAMGYPITDEIREASARFYGDED